MKINRIAFIFTCLACMGLFTGHAQAAKKVVVISGVDQEAAYRVGYDLVYEGLNGVFLSAGVDLEHQWVELNSMESKASKAAAGAKALAKARALLPVVFAWVFGSPDSLGLPEPNITGVLFTT